MFILRVLQQTQNNTLKIAPFRSPFPLPSIELTPKPNSHNVIRKRRRLLDDDARHQSKEWTVGQLGLGIEMGNHNNIHRIRIQTSCCPEDDDGK